MEEEKPAERAIYLHRVHAVLRAPGSPQWGLIEGGDDNPGSPSTTAVSDIFSEPYDANEKTCRKPGDPFDDEDDDWWGEGEEYPEEEDRVE